LTFLFFREKLISFRNWRKKTGNFLIRRLPGAYDFAILKKGNDIFLIIQRLRTSTSQSLIHNNFALMNSSHSHYTLLSTCRLYKWTPYGGSGIILNIFIRVSKGRTNFRVFLTIESSNIYFYLRVRVKLLQTD
jgi:hypothetical protein